MTRFRKYNRVFPRAAQPDLFVQRYFVTFTKDSIGRSESIDFNDRAVMTTFATDYLNMVPALRSAILCERTERGNIVLQTLTRKDA